MRDVDLKVHIDEGGGPRGATAVARVDAPIVHFVVDVLQEKEKWLELRYVSGEPRDIRLRFDVEELDGGEACILRSSGEFDVKSLGWLAKYFLRHHPEIQFGVVPGVAVALLESMRAAAVSSG